MREVAFIKQNKAKWLEFELAIFGKSKKNPDEMAGLYIHLVNDLSYAQTYYPKSKTVIYLNYLASQVFQKIYKTRRTERKRIRFFFETEVPLLLYQYKRYILYAFTFFFATVAIGLVSSRYDMDFIRLMLGDDYINTTLENIKGGNPVAIYKSGSNWGSAISITLNNLQVGTMSFFLGITGGIGTLYKLMQEAIRLAAFQYLFFKEGVFWESVRGIWIHGAMEIFAMVIEAAAGLVLGASILFPATYSRMNAFKIGFRNAIKIFLSTFPFTIAAGILEGFITRYSIIMQNWCSSLIIMFTLSCISFYYLIYPFMVHKKMQADRG